MVTRYWQLDAYKMAKEGRERIFQLSKKCLVGLTTHSESSEFTTDRSGLVVKPTKKVSQRGNVLTDRSN